jgi:hypothetical protein
VKDELNRWGDGEYEGNPEFLASYEAMALSCQSIWTKLQDLQPQSEYVDTSDSEELSDNVCVRKTTSLNNK